MNDDWFDAMVALLDHGARFLVVGAHAMAVYGVPRGTHDLDMWVEPTAENAKRVYQALTEFGAPLTALGITAADLTRRDAVIQLGLPPNRIDLLTSLSGVPDFGAAWETRFESTVRDREIPFLSKACLIDNKRAVGRTKDHADVDALGEAPSRPAESD
jgi:hypothetical protein